MNIATKIAAVTELTSNPTMAETRAQKLARLRRQWATERTIRVRGAFAQHSNPHDGFAAGYKVGLEVDREYQAMIAPLLPKAMRPAVCKTGSYPRVTPGDVGDLRAWGRV